MRRRSVPFRPAERQRNRHRRSVPCRDRTKGPHHLSLPGGKRTGKTELRGRGCCRPTWVTGTELIYGTCGEKDWVILEFSLAKAWLFSLHRPRTTFPRI